MSNTHKHKEKGKFNNKIITYEETSESTKQMWNRQIFDVGYYRHLRKKLEEKINNL